MNNINILYYSNKCEGSKLLISMLHQEKLLEFFHAVCTDNNIKVPPEIIVTPTIIIRGQPILYVAHDAFVWLAKMKQWKISMSMKKMNAMQQQYMQNISNNLENDANVLGYSSSEMNNASDMFSFFSRDIAQEVQEPLPQSYFSYNNIGNDKIFAPPLEDGTYKVNLSAKYKIDDKKQRQLCKNLEQERKKQDTDFMNNINNFVTHINNISNKKS